MHATAVPVAEPSVSVREVPDSEALALLLDLMADEPAEVPRPAGLPHHRWATRVQDLSRRASSWGAGPQGAWRAW
ncbi:hypothetical protein [Blastococcus saxobsidens]|uniref:Uncharacterized protein n=1 Tax=Blastococcus saxobsidens (strain DD2) TaxID=1146883 RepID=H6RRC2_BLASD|nr:hypothetical protein [Blastococcus saxobsidens]CCG05404.1 conserved protein of unknown function [Blastococcus saxobsidens DD2]